MVKEIVKNSMFLCQKSTPAAKTDLQVGRDLKDTLMFHRGRCVGLAANMIGVRKNVIIVDTGQVALIMFNPVLLKKEDPFEAEEGCLSLEGTRKTTRYRKIEVEYFDMQWKKRRVKLQNWPAQICQHEMDHLHGILI